MTLKKLEGHRGVVDSMLADPLHTRQVVRSLKHVPITGQIKTKTVKLRDFWREITMRLSVFRTFCI